MTTPPVPLAAMSITPGELTVTFLVFHLPARPLAPLTRSKVMELFEDEPSAFITLPSTVRVLPSAEILTVSIETTLPLALLVDSQLFAPSDFQMVVPP